MNPTSTRQVAGNAHLAKVFRTRYNSELQVRTSKMPTKTDMKNKSDAKWSEIVQFVNKID